ncbi:hypothetical protein LUZ60_006986 [Juncus effusus]|nr:hypothetical protein LUZ60_006986 [Juncus effusus]
MEGQRSFSPKPTKLLLLTFTISSSFLLCFIFFSCFLSFIPFFSTQRYFRGFKGTKARFSSNGTEDSVLDETHFVEDANSSSETFNLVMTEKDVIMADVSVEERTDLSHKPLNLRNGEEELRSNASHLSKSSKIAQIGRENGTLKTGIAVSNERSNDANKIKKEVKEQCDFYDGKWVFDESYPLYKSKSCPYIDEGFSCEANGKINNDYMKWRWKPNHCDIPRFDPVKMLEMIKGKRLVFVGDSINRNQWESMMCMLSQAVSDPKRVYETRGRRITKERGHYSFKFADYNCSVEYHVTHFLVHESKARVGTKRMKTLRIDTIDRGSSKWRNADVLVFNTAHWWSHHKTKAGLNYYQERDVVHPKLDVSIAFQKSLTTWASWVDQYVNPKKTLVFFRSSSPSHFSGGEWNSGGHCKESTQPLNSTKRVPVSEKNIILQRVIERMKTRVTILNITNLSGLRIDGHPSIYGKKDNSLRGVQDCSHWCVPGVPDTWNELLYYHLVSSFR